MEASGVVDPSTKPIVLFGIDTALLGALTGPYPAKWRNKTAGRALHVVLEGSEPSTGQRWCRTYFLQHGQVATTTDNIHINREQNSSIDSKNGDNNSRSSSNHISYVINEDVSSAIHRLESLYVKLSICLRWLVKTVFSKHSDVLEAGTEIQVFYMMMMMMLMLIDDDGCFD